MKVAIYARVSTGEQDETLQIPRLTDYAERAGWEIVQIYQDQATAKNCDRPGWLAMMSDARRHHFDRILITKLDRMMRSVRLLLDELETLHRYEVQVYALDIGVLDLDNPGSRLLLTVLGSIAEWEGEMISTRTREGLKARKDRGEPLGRPRLDIPIHMIALGRIAGATWESLAIKYHISRSSMRNYRPAIEEEINEIRMSELEVS